MFKKLKNYIQESRLELKRVNWPTKKATARLTWMVVSLCIIFAVFLGLLDFLFNYVLANYVIQ